MSSLTKGRAPSWIKTSGFEFLKCDFNLSKALKTLSCRLFPPGTNKNRVPFVCSSFTWESAKMAFLDFSSSSLKRVESSLNGKVTATTEKLSVFKKARVAVERTVPPFSGRYSFFMPPILLEEPAATISRASSSFC